MSGSLVEFRGCRRLSVVSQGFEIQAVSLEHGFVYTDVRKILVQWTGKVGDERSLRVIRVRCHR